MFKPGLSRYKAQCNIVLQTENVVLVSQHRCGVLLLGDYPLYYPPRGSLSCCRNEAMVVNTSLADFEASGK